MLETGPTLNIAAANDSDLAQGLDVRRLDLILVLIAEMATDIVYHIRQLLVGEVAAKGRHALVAVHHHAEDITGAGQPGVACQRRISARPCRTLGIGHMTALADAAIDGLSALHRERRASEIGCLLCGSRHNTDHQRDQNDAKDRPGQHHSFITLYSLLWHAGGQWRQAPRAPSPPAIRAC